MMRFTLSLFLVIQILNLNGVHADGVGQFVTQLATEFPHWLSTNYPNSSYPYPSTRPIRVELRQGGNANDSVEIDVEFLNYEVHNHTKPENWNIYKTLVDISGNIITVDLNLWRTSLKGTYVANGTFNCSLVSGRGNWIVQGNQFIGVGMNYLGVEVTPDLYVDLNAGPMEGGYSYIYGNLKEMDGLDAGGYEEIVKTLALDALHDLLSDKLEHPLVEPLNRFFQDAFASTTIPDM